MDRQPDRPPLPDLLHLPLARMVSCQTIDFPRQYAIGAEVDTVPAVCKKCGGTDFGSHGADKEAQVFVDQPIRDHAVTVLVTRKRFRCKACGKTASQPLPQMALEGMEDGETRSGGATGYRMTKRAVDYVGKAGLHKTFVDVSREVGVDDHIVRRIVSDHIRRLEKQIVFETPEWLGLDEIHILDKVVGVATSIDRHTLVNLLPDRTDKVLGKWIENLPDKDLVKVVAIDMWRPYAAMVEKYLPNAVLVIDRFHVVRMANEALDDVRKAVQRTLTKEDRIALKHERKALYARESKLDKKGRAAMEKWTGGHPLLGDIWAAKELYMNIWDTAPSSAKAMAMYDEWVTMLPEALHQPLFPLTRAMVNWREPIFRYFDNRITNAYTEALNSVTRVVNRVGRGYTFDVLRAKMLYAHGQHCYDGVKADRRLGWSRSTSGGGHNPRTDSNWGVPLLDLADMIERGEFAGAGREPSVTGRD